ncbi:MULTISPECIES: LPP leucine zipper domain-containing protein [Enterovibrio]|uniref:Major outer membrane lipoprotein Lpp n=2 Tax=Enterovibrio norvegicus TaxID=188144 RepID=A0A2N7LH47_9GAMM|nr:MULTISPECIES: LPP leucine zipper domain-containing protein [Enterovibrio]MBE1273353.1 hypothetical protein [Enterovibrio baiacu]MCC4798603.1 hypothetical protein [Enterovibrio norvegicus]OEE65189.1 hypothetical protein A1OS_14670 [Enterovibrio norvegicus]OEF51651.1 hypothetical protein A1OW_00750 [Enterovibrio norvegicus]OEF57002.1 hypothetical protein A1OU_19855 [Enterovibrio norvegicus]
MKMRLLTLAAIASSAVLVGCSGSSSLEQSVADLSSKVDSLSNQVSALQGDVSDVAAASALSYDEAARANERIDNMAQSYTK